MRQIPTFLVAFVAFFRYTLNPPMSVLQAVPGLDPFQKYTNWVGRAKDRMEKAFPGQERDGYIGQNPIGTCIDTYRWDFLSKCASRSWPGKALLAWFFVLKSQHILSSEHSNRYGPAGEASRPSAGPAQSTTRNTYLFTIKSRTRIFTRFLLIKYFHCSVFLYT